MDLKILSDSELLGKTKAAAQREKQATLELLEYLSEVEVRRLFAKRAYSSLFEFVVKELQYSETQASERINAMRLMRKNPEVKEKIQLGSLSMSTASKLERFFRTEKKIASKDYSHKEKMSLISECENQSKRKVEKLLLERSLIPNPEFKERMRIITPALTELRCAVSENCIETLSEIRNIKGQGPSLSHILEEAFQIYLVELKKRAFGKTTTKTINKMCESQTASSSCPIKTVTLPVKRKASENQTRYIPRPVRAATLTRSEGQCEFVDVLTQKRCHSRYRLQFEHRQPYSAGGCNDSSNIAHFCAAHNQLSAIEFLGYAKMAKHVPSLR